MAKKVLVIVPTRARSGSLPDFYESFINSSEISDLVLGLDDDDASSYPKIDGVLYEINPRLGMNGTLNFIANKYAGEYEYLAFMGDDHRTRTPGWDTKLVETISNFSNGIAYGNDLFQGENLPTAVLLDSNIVRTLGFMAPPNQKHLYLDNFWKDLGKRLGTLRYSDEVIIEHMHYLAGKSQEDAGYIEVNNSAMYEHDRIAYEEYQKIQFEQDVEKLFRS